MGGWKLIVEDNNTAPHLRLGGSQTDFVCDRVSPVMSCSRKTVVRTEKWNLNRSWPKPFRLKVWGESLVSDRVYSTERRKNYQSVLPISNRGGMCLETCILGAGRENCNAFWKHPNPIHKNPYHRKSASLLNDSGFNKPLSSPVLAQILSQPCPFGFSREKIRGICLSMLDFSKFKRMLNFENT